jgi:hypothetical protein
MTYATAAQVALRLGNATIGVAGGTLINDADLAEVLTECDAMINAQLDVTTNVTDEPYLSLLRKIEVDLVAMFILQNRHFREQNLTENTAAFWQITPDFTYAHKDQLMLIRQRLQSQTFIGNTETGVIQAK